MKHESGMPDNGQENITNVPEPNTPAKFLHAISYEDLMWLHEMYLNKKHGKLSELIGKDNNPMHGETRWIWFSKASLQGFLEQFLLDTSVTGLKVYLCTYPDNVEKGLPHDKEYVKQLTVGFVATTRSKDGSEMEDYPKTEENQGTLVVGPSPQNHGTLCPPKCS